RDLVVVVNGDQHASAYRCHRPGRAHVARDRQQNVCARRSGDWLGLHSYQPATIELPATWEFDLPAATQLRTGRIQPDCGPVPPRNALENFGGVGGVATSWTPQADPATTQQVVARSFATAGSQDAYVRLSCSAFCRGYGMWFAIWAGPVEDE